MRVSLSTWLSPFGCVFYFFLVFNILISGGSHMGAVMPTAQIIAHKTYIIIGHETCIVFLLVFKSRERSPLCWLDYIIINVGCQSFLVTKNYPFKRVVFCLDNYIISICCLHQIHLCLHRILLRFLELLVPLVLLH